VTKLIEYITMRRVFWFCYIHEVNEFYEKWLRLSECEIGCISKIIAISDIYLKYIY
jgi:hypothetical protein